MGDKNKDQNGNQNGGQNNAQRYGSESDWTDSFNAITGTVNAGTNLFALPFNIYDQYQQRKMQKESLALQKRKMDEDWIKNQRDEEWKRNFRNHMLGIA